MKHLVKYVKLFVVKDLKILGKALYILKMQ